MLIIGSLLAAIIPMLSYLFIIWRLDKYEREPLGFIFGHFVWGAFGAVILSYIGNSILYMLLSLFIGDSVILDIGEAVFIAPFVEELMKGMILLVTVRSLKFDNMTDGLVYGGAVGLGFGMTENFIYFLGYGDSFTSWLVLVIIRSGFSAVMHCIATASFGAMLGAAKNSGGLLKIIYPSHRYFNCHVYAFYVEFDRQL